MVATFHVCVIISLRAEQRRELGIHFLFDATDSVGHRQLHSQYHTKKLEWLAARITTVEHT